MPIIPHAESIPRELRELRHWICWKWGDRGGKPTKVPIAPDGGPTGTNVTWRHTWRSFDEAVAGIERGAEGVGFVFTETPYVGVDLDWKPESGGDLGPVFDEDEGRPTEWAAGIIRDLAGAYFEVSQSGNGIHAICRGTMPAEGKRKGQVEMYSTTSPRYFAITGRAMDSDYLAGQTQDPLPDLTDKLALVHKRFIAEPSEQPQAQLALDASPQASPTAPPSELAQLLIASARSSSEARRFFSFYDSGEYFNDNKKSEADYDLACILWRQPGATEDAVVEAMASSALLRDRWHTKRGAITLLRHTVREARKKFERGGTDQLVEYAKSQTGTELASDLEVFKVPQAVAPFLAWANRTTLFAGREKWSGKSTILTAAAAAVTRGAQWLGQETGEPGRVLWVSADLEPKADVFQRFERFGADHGRWSLMYPAAARFEHRLAELEAELVRLDGEQRRPTWLIIDTTAHFALVEEAGQASGWIQTLVPLRKLAQRFELASTLVHHSARSAPNEYRDSTAIGGIVDQVIIYQNKTDDRAGTRRHALSLGRIVGARRDWEVDLQGNDFVLVSAEKSPEERMLPFVVSAARRGGAEGLTKAELKDRIHDDAKREGVRYSGEQLGKYVQHAIDARKLLANGERWLPAPEPKEQF